MKTLLDLLIGETAVVQKMAGGLRMQIQLKNLGFHEGVSVTLIKKSVIGGPLMVTINGSHVAIGRGVASKVMVSPIEGCAEEPGEANTPDGATQ